MNFYCNDLLKKWLLFTCILCLNPTPIIAVNQTIQLSEGENSLLLLTLSAIKQYIGDIRIATDIMFTTKGNFPNDLKKMEELRDRIRKIAKEVPRGLSPESYHVFKQLKALTQYLSEAQTIWASALATKKLKELKAIRKNMNTYFLRIKDQIFGTKNGTGGLRGYAATNNEESLIVLIDAIFSDIDYAFNFPDRNSILKSSFFKTRDMAVGFYLRDHKGFSMKGVIF